MSNEYLTPVSTGVFSVKRRDNSEDLQVTVNSRKMNEQGMCLFVNAADISITE